MLQVLQVLQGGDLVVKQLEEHGVVSCLLAEVAVTVCVCVCVSLKHTSISTCMCESDAICIERLHMCGLSSFSNTQVEILSHMVAIYIVLVKKID